MDRPRLFLSAVSQELRTARNAVAATVRTLGYDPVSQDDFPTGHGELRQWLRREIDSCEGLMQIVGQGYGAEPPEVDPEWGRVSYTQFEFLYARRQGKKTWFIVAGEQCYRDRPPGRTRPSRRSGPSGPGRLPGRAAAAPAGLPCPACSVRTTSGTRPTTPPSCKTWSCVCGTSWASCGGGRNAGIAG